MTAPTPLRYRVDDYQSSTDPRRMATIRDVLTATTLTVTAEDEARHLIEQLTAWLDAPRLAARETAEVVDRAGWKYGKCGIELLCTEFGEHSVRKDDGGYLMGWTLTRDAEWLFQSIRKENRP